MKKEKTGVIHQIEETHKNNLQSLLEHIKCYQALPNMEKSIYLYISKSEPYVGPSWILGDVFPSCQTIQIDDKIQERDEVIERKGCRYQIIFSTTNLNHFNTKLILIYNKVSYFPLCKRVKHRKFRRFNKVNS